MPGVAVVTDRTADLPPEMARRHGITVVPLPVGVGDDRFPGGVDLESDPFLHRLARSPVLPTTSRPPPSSIATPGPVVATQAGPGVIGFIVEREDAPVG